MIVIGFDPGKQTGIAIFEDGNLIDLITCKPIEAVNFIRALARHKAVCALIEDSRAQSHVFTATNLNRASALKIARNVGMVDAYCDLLFDACEEYKFTAISVSPKDKGKKLNADEFKQLTGWTEASNQHERDAAVVAWKFRGWKGNGKNYN